MKTKCTISILSIFLLFCTVTLFSQRAVGQATVTSDQPDYAPMSNAVFTGSGFWPNENVVLRVKNLFRPCNTTSGDSSYMPWTVTAGALGEFITNWTVCNCPGDSLRLKATGQSSGQIAYLLFSDGPNDIFRSVASGNWNSISTWEYQPGGSGSFIPATFTPTAANSASTITIRNGHNVTVTAGVTTDQVVVALGGQLTINSGVVFDLSNGTGTDLLVAGTVALNGTLSQSGNTIISINGGFNINSTGLVNGGGGNTASRPEFIVNNGGDWTIAAGGSFATSGSGPTIITVGTGGIATLNGTVSGPEAMTINGSVSSSANITMASVSNLQVSGSLTMTAGTMSLIRGNGGAVGGILSGGIITLSGTSKISIGTVGTAYLAIATGGTLDMGPGAIVEGLGFLNVGNCPPYDPGGTPCNGANLKIGSSDGIVNSTTVGNVRTSGTDVYSTGANYIYNGTAAQSAGNGLPAIINSLTISNLAGVTLSSAKTVSNTLSITAGALNLGTYTHSARTLTLGGVGAAAGSWGSSTSPATNTNNTYFAATSGIVNVNTSTAPLCTTPAQPQDFTVSSSVICGGQSGLIYTVPNDASLPTVTYTWSYSGTGVIINGTGNSVTVDFSNTATSGTLSVTASRVCGTSSPRTINITVNTSPSTTQPTDQTITYGANLSFSVVASGTGPFTYQWQEKTPTGSFTDIIDDIVYSGATSASLSLTKPGVSMSGNTYRVIVIGACAPESTSVEASLTVEKAVATVSVTGYTGTYDAQSHGATGSATGVAGDLTATGSSLDLGASFTDAPGGTADWTFTGGANYTDQNGSVAIVINKADATIDIIPYSGVYDAQSHTASGTATGVASVDLSSGLSFATSHTNAPGGNTAWSFDGGTNYNDASGTTTVTISKADATIDITPYSGVYDAQSHTASGTATGVANADLSSGLSFATSHTNAPGGNTAWSFDGGTNYNDASGTTTVTIAKADATIDITPYSGVYDAQAHTASGTATGVASVDLSSGLSFETSHTNAPGGNTAWSFDGGTNYNDASGTTTVTISKADATIDIIPYSGVYDAQSHTASGTATGVASVDLSSGLSFATSHTNAPGGNTAWSFDGGTNYNDASGTTTVTIAKADATIDITPYSGVYDAQAHTASGTATGVASVDLSSGLSFETSHTNAPGGNTAWSFDGGTNYNDASGTTTVTISKADATIDIIPYSGVYDAQSHTASGTATGVANADLSSGLSFATSHTNVPGGNTAWSFDGGTNYNDASGTTTVTISKADATIDITPYSGVYDAQAHTASGTATGVASVDLSSGLSFETSHTNAPGGNTAWSFDGGTNYNDASGTTTVTISKADALVTVNGYTGVYDAVAHGATGAATGVDAGGAAAGSTLTLGSSFTNVPGGTASWNFEGGTNYTDQNGSVEIVINKKPITGNFTVSPTKVYDGGTLAAVTGRSLNDVIGSDDVSLNGGEANYDTKHVLDNKVVTLTGMTLAGSKAHNYMLTGVATSTANITKRTVTISAQPDSKMYDGDILSSVLPVKGELQTGDTYSENGSQTYDNRNVGTGKVLSATGVTIEDDNSGNNYTIDYITNNFGVITIRPIVVSANSNTKAYDGNISSAASPTVPTLQTNDVISTSPIQVYDNELPGTGKTMTASGLVIDDANGGLNYSISYVTNNTGVITKATTTTTLNTSAVSVRFMDALTMTARIVPNPYVAASPLTGSVVFKIGSVFYPAVTVVPDPTTTNGTVVATLIPQVSNLPGNYTVEAFFTSTNTNYSGSESSKPLEVKQREASPFNDEIGFYTGTLFAWTTGPSSSTATVALTTTIKDLNAPRGDLRGAKVTFYLVNGTSITPIASAQNLPVGLVDINDGSVGTASAIVQLNIGSNNAQDFRIAVGITGSYFNNPNTADAQSIITISKPVPGGYMVTGGKTRNVSSSGYIKGHPGKRTDFQTDITYTKSGTNPKGKATVIIRSYYKSDGTLGDYLRTYEIKTNAIASLNISNVPKPVSATFSAKANLVEHLPNGSTVAIEGGSTFNMVVYKNATGACDQEVAITLYRKEGGVWFSSNWNGTGTVLQDLSEGEVSIPGASTCSPYTANVTTTATRVANDNLVENAKPTPAEETVFDITVIGANPTSSEFMLKLQSPTKDRFEVRIINQHGSTVEVVKATPGQTIRFGNNYARGTYFAQVRQAGKSKVVKLLKL